MPRFKPRYAYRYNGRDIQMGGLTDIFQSITGAITAAAPTLTTLYTTQAQLNLLQAQAKAAKAPVTATVTNGVVSYNSGTGVPAVNAIGQGAAPYLPYIIGAGAFVALALILKK